MPDKEYYYLEKGEIIREGDECGTTQKYNDYYIWVKETNCVGQPAPDPQYISHRKYRRLIEKEPEFCMPDNVNTKEEYYQYLSDIGCIKWQFVEWAEKATGECIIKGTFNDMDFEATGIKNCGEIVSVSEIKLIKS